MMQRPDQIAARIEAWLESEFSDTSPADIAQALDIVRRRSTSRSVPDPATGPTITPADLLSVGEDELGLITRQQLFDAVHAWEQISLRDPSPAASFWHYTPDYAIQVRYEVPAGADATHYIRVFGYHQDTRPGQERPEDVLVRAIVHWEGPPQG